MIVPTKSTWLAVHRLFGDAGIHAGQCLGLKEMMQAWGQTGLRQHDLADALDSLVRLGFVKLSMSAQGPLAHLVDESFGLLHANGRDNAALLSLTLLRETRDLPSPLSRLIPERMESRRSDDHASRKTLARTA